jgi:hypothetical protein
MLGGKSNVIAMLDTPVRIKIHLFADGTYCVLLTDFYILHGRSGLVMCLPILQEKQTH